MILVLPWVFITEIMRGGRLSFFKDDDENKNENDDLFKVWRRCCLMQPTTSSTRFVTLVSIVALQSTEGLTERSITHLKAWDLLTQNKSSLKGGKSKALEIFLLLHRGIRNKK